MNKTPLILTFFALVLCGALSTFAQQPTATLTGVLTDPNGAVITGASVTVTNSATNLSRTVATNDNGAYNFPDLPVGRYEISIDAAGFTKTKIINVALEVGQTVTRDRQLEVITLDTIITIDDTNGTPLVETQTSKIDAVINDKEIENLPLNGRNFLELALLTPGNAPAPNFDPTKTNTVVISSAGGLGRGGNVMIDGTDNNDDVVGGALINISQDAVREFQVATNRFSAEYGRSASSVINVVTKSGTNNLRGSLAFFERDKKLQALPATFDRRNPAPPFDRQQYSFTLGGPLVKDKLFAFGALEYRDQNGAVLVGIRDVANRRLTSGFAAAPLKDWLLNGRLDYLADDRNGFNFRYSFEDVDATDSSKLDRPIGSASYRQNLQNRFHSFMANWSHVLSPRMVNNFSFSVNDFENATDPTATGVQYTFPSILDGSSFRVPQGTTQRRLQFSDAFTATTGSHTLKFGGEFQRVDSSLFLGVFRQGRIEFVENFAEVDRNGDGQINDLDLLFAVTLRSALPDRDLFLDDVDNDFFAFFAQDDWRVTPNLTLNLGLRYEVDTDVKNNSGYDEINSLVAGFYRGERKADRNNFAPRVGFNYSTFGGKLSFRGGYGIYYDRVTLQLITLERGLDGRALPVAVRAGNALTAPNGAPIFLDQNGRFVPGAPTVAAPFSGFILPGAGASGINIIDNRLQNPMVQQSNLGLQWEFARNFVLRADYLHNFGTHFIIGRNIGVVNNPVVGGPDRVVNLESSVKFKYDALLLSVEKRFADRFGFRANYTLAKAFNYANDDQIPFSNGPVDSSNLQLEYGPTPNDQRHRFTFAGTVDLPYGFRLSPILTLASGVPMDILVSLPDGTTRIPQLQRNAGGRIIKNAGELNSVIRQINSAGGVRGNLLPLAPADARFNDDFKSLDLRLSKVFTFKERFRLEPIVEVFNVFNTNNFLGVSNTNYSGFGNVLGAENFGRPVTTAGGVFGSGGPRAFQFAARFSF
ncbi:MAG TPA: TonB-dependent receptor [Pyrinomonadaceae bacterium]|jgi:outer membrane receptor protein involved in Fe transport